MTRIGSVYAQALYSLAQDEGKEREILSELSVLDQAFAQTPDYLRLLSLPSLSKDERCGVIDKSLTGKVQPYVLNFLKILTEKGYIARFADCCKAYRSLYNEEHGILPVRAVTSVPLTDKQAERLAQKLAQITGKQIELDNVIDPSCMGGVRLDYEGKRVDDTIAHRLDALRAMLKNTIL